MNCLTLGLFPYRKNVSIIKDISLNGVINYDSQCNYNNLQLQ